MAVTLSSNRFHGAFISVLGINRISPSNDDYEGTDYGSYVDGGKLVTALSPRFDLVRSIMESTQYRFGDVDPDVLVGFRPHQPERERPVTFGDFQIWSGRYDHNIEKAYPSNILNSYALYCSRESPPSKAALSRDRWVVHHNSEGTLNISSAYQYYRFFYGPQARVVTGVFVPGYVDAVWEPTGHRRIAGAWWMNLRSSSPGGFDNFEPWIVDSPSPAGPVLPTLDYLRSVSSTLKQNWVRYQYAASFQLDSFEWSCGPTSCDWSYTFSSSIFNAWALRQTNSKWRVQAGLRLVPTGYLTAVSNGWKQTFGYIVRPYYAYKLLSGDVHFPVGVEYVSAPMQTYSGSVIVPTSGPEEWWRPLIGSNTGERSIRLETYTSTLRSEASEHGQHWDKYRQEIRKSSVYSFHNALERELLHLRSNYLEVLKEIPELPELIPDLATLLKIIKLYRDARLVDATLLLGDFVTSLNLQWSFGTRPNIDVVKELNTAGPRLLDLASPGKTRTKTLYGTFRFKIPKEDSFGHGQSEMVTRSKVSISYEDNPIWNVVLALYGVRLLPNLENTWALRPGSFVVDWFTNMSSRFKHLDMSLLQFAFRFNFLEHSYTITSQPNGTFTEGVSLDDTLHPSYWLKYYVRDISFTVPQLSEGRWDYLAVQGSPNVGIFASLLYQLLRR